MNESKITTEQTWLSDFVDSMKPQYQEDIAQFVDSMTEDDWTDNSVE